MCFGWWGVEDTSTAISSGRTFQIMINLDLYGAFFSVWFDITLPAALNYRVEASACRPLHRWLGAAMDLQLQNLHAILITSIVLYLAVIIGSADDRVGHKPRLLQGVYSGASLM